MAGARPARTAGLIRPSSPASAGALDALTFTAGYASLGEPFVEERVPTPLPNPYLVAFEPEVASLLGLAANSGATPEFLAIAAGNVLPRGAHPTAAVYAGHQFGTYVPQLGDGRAITLGDVENAQGERWEWQLKGSGLTAFSRFGDGRAVLRSTIREYLCSEALYHLGIPTTRALAIAGSDAPVFRETIETSAVLSRIAPSHVRFGTFEFFHYRQLHDRVKTLADYVIDRFFPDAAAAGDERYAAFLSAVVRRTAVLMAGWQAAGFAHGVMNTDNMSILGLTLDYGPFGFVEAYDPEFVCNHTDESGRYAFDRQPGIALWNCYALASALGSLVTKPQAQSALDEFEQAFRDAYLERMRAKLGLAGVRPDDGRLIVDVLDILAAAKADYPIFWRTLSTLGAQAGEADAQLAAPFADAGALHAWLIRYRARVGDQDDASRRAAMHAVNPVYVLRNHLAQTAIEAAQKRDFSELERLMERLRRPYDEQPGFERYALPAPPGAPVVEVSCSS